MQSSIKNLAILIFVMILQPACSIAPHYKYDQIDVVARYYRDGSCSMTVGKTIFDRSDHQWSDTVVDKIIYRNCREKKGVIKLRGLNLFSRLSYTPSQKKRVEGKDEPSVMVSTESSHTLKYVIFGAAALAKGCIMMNTKFSMYEGTFTMNQKDFVQYDELVGKARRRCSIG